MASDDSIVVAALSVEEATILGLTRLTATRDEVDIEILDEGNRGFLSIGAREARVRLTKRPQREAAVRAPVPPVEAVEQGVETSTPSTIETMEMTADRTPAPRASVPPATSDGPATVPAGPSVPEPVVARSAEKRVGGDEGRFDRAAIEAVARDIMAHLLPGLSLAVSTEWIDEDRPTLWVSVTGRDADSLVGPRARSLHSLQYLFRALIYQKADGNYNVVVDADGYRRRRRRSLESLAQKKADQAVEQGQAIRLRAMPAHERRIVHIVLKEDDRVSTESTGRGRDRAITIVPKGSSRRNRS
ncbi:MAG: Jag N-terminal domain-containing protein [Anaerolineae bacterium]|nr:Jag N-terminal domain-containing protein [Anaerolineae bacterium]